MGRPEPCVLFSQSFVHPHLDEYVDEVIFAEPIVITACEFLEQNASSASPIVTLLGATSPPSFALEVFVQCEGEPQFRRLCQPFLYSHSSSNVLEVEAVVTNHLVVRGSYRSLTLVVYGNTAEDLGQFNIEFDLDSSLANLVCSPSEGKLEDLPPALHSTKLTFEESISSLKSLSLPVSEPELPVAIKQILQLTLKICQTSDLEDVVRKVVNAVVSVVSSYVTDDVSGKIIARSQHVQSNILNSKNESERLLIDARNELLELYRVLQQTPGSPTADLVGGDSSLDFEVDLATPELLVDLFNQCSLFKSESPAISLAMHSQKESMIVGLSVVLLMCSGRENCFRFVNGGGMEQLARVFCHETQKSPVITLMLLGVVERATRHAVGCEGFLGWWPREDESLPICTSEGYNHLLKLLLQKQRHDVACLCTYVLHRLRTYEIASRYESAILSVLGSLSAVGRVTNPSLDSLVAANSQLKKLLKLLNFHGPIEDPSPVASARRSVILGHAEGLLSYRATINLVTSSKYCFANWDIDTHLLSLLRERGFLPLSAALLSSTLRSEKGHTMDIFLDIAASIEGIILSFLFCRSGLIFLLLQPEVTSAMILSLQGVEHLNKEECMPLRYAAVSISKGFFCRPQEIGLITELHLRVVNAVDRLLVAVPHSEELLWVLWELCALSRSHSGRHALLALGHFPEAILVLMEALSSVKEVQPTALSSGTSPLSLAIFHSAAELFEVMVTDSTATSLGSWVGHAVDLHKALHSSSPGSNRKDAPTRLLEWIDAGVVYHRNGAIGLLRYAAVLASGGDAHLTSTSILVSDSMDVENVVGDSSSGSDVQVENLLGKLVSDKCFDGVTLRDSSVAQLMTTFRILASISENSAVAVSLYEEGAVTLVYVVLLDCKLMLERSSSTYDYLVDEGAECNSTSDLLLERSREQSIVDLMIPALVLLISLLQKLREAKEQHRNKKLLTALLRLHREVSPKLAACAADVSFPYPGSTLGLGAVCHLLVSAIACWPSFGWTPCLFHCMLESVQATSSLALGPKDACSLLCILGDLFPEEGIWLWKNEIPSLSALRILGVGTLLGPERERDVDWYLQPGHVAMVLSRLAPHVDKIGQIILHFAFTALVVIHDMLRVFIVRIACQKSGSAAILLQPIISWLHDHLSETSSLSDTDSFKVYRLLDFVTSLLEHPRSKTLLLKAGAINLLLKALEICSDISNSDDKLLSEIKNPANGGFSLLSWCLPVFKSLALIFDFGTSSHHTGVYDKFILENVRTEDFSLIGRHLLKLCQVLSVGRELQACLVAFQGLASCSQGRAAFACIFLELQSSGLEDQESERGKERDGNDSLPDECDWKRSPPLLICLKKLLESVDEKDASSNYAIEAVHALSLGALHLCMEGKSLEGVSVLKCLFGLPHDFNGMGNFPEEKLKDVHELVARLDLMLSEDEYSASSNLQSNLNQVKESVKSMLLLLQKHAGSDKMEDVLPNAFTSSSDVPVPSKIFAPLTAVDGEAGPSLSWMWSYGTAEKSGSYSFLGGLADKFMWECPDSSPDRLLTPALPLKRKLPSVEGSSRRSRGDNLGAEMTGSNAFPRGLGAPTVSSGPTRRDTFRQRKPNTSRPPSMHVDDYVARERNVDGASGGPNVVSSVQRGGPTGGRPPSIHVDEFMARQRERQNPIAMTVGEVMQVRNSSLENDNDPDKFDRSRQLKADLDDDLQEINIVFDEESESDDKLPFPQPDDNLQPAPVIIDESSPHSVIEESETDVNETAQFSHLFTPPASKVDGSTHSEFPLRRSTSRTEMSGSREASISSEKKYHGTSAEKTLFPDQSDDPKHIPITSSKGFEASTMPNLSPYSAQFYTKRSGSPSFYPLGDSRLPPPKYYQGSPRHTTNVDLPTGSQEFYDQKPPPPLPPFPPPPTVSPILSHPAEPFQSHSSPYGHSARDVQPPLPTGYPLQAFTVSGSGAPSNFHLREDRHLVNNFPPPTSTPSSEPLVNSFPSQIHTDYLSMASYSSMTSLNPSHSVLDSKYSWATAASGSRLHDDTNSSSGSSRPPPPLPPMPPPFSTAPVTQISMKTSSSQSPLYSQTSVVGTQLPLPSTPLSDTTRLGTFSSSGNSPTSYSMPTLGPSLLLARPASLPGTLFSSSPPQHLVQNPPTLSHTVPSQPSIQPVPPRPPPQLTQLPRPPHPPQHPRPQIQVSQQLEQGLSIQHPPIQMQLQPLQVPQQLHIPQMNVYFQPQPQEHLVAPQQQLTEQSQLHNLHPNGDTSQQQQDSGMSLQQYFSSPEAIQSLLSDREKLCQLLEQHPKLMQMLQERLGQQ